MTWVLSAQNKHTLRLGIYLGFAHLLLLGASLTSAIHNPFNQHLFKRNIVRLQLCGIAFLSLAPGAGTLFQLLFR